MDQSPSAIRLVRQRLSRVFRFGSVSKGLPQVVRQGSPQVHSWRVSLGSKGFALPLVILIVLAFLVFFALVVERFVFNDQHLNLKKTGRTEAGEECLSDPNPTFTAEFIDRSKILFIKPLGDTQVDSTTRSRIVLKEGTEVPIYNPVDATLETITKKDEKYKLSLRVSCEVSYVFDGLIKVLDGINAQELIKKGELLGYVKGADQGSSFDFMVSNNSKPVSHINSKRWEQDLYVQCPYDYFDTRNDNNLRRDYIAYNLVHNDNIIQKVWNKEQGVSSIPCGDLSHDIAGTASGGWFKGGSTDIKGDYLSVNKYLSTVQVTIRKDGKLVEALTDYSPDILLPGVKPGSPVCYHDANQNKWVFVRLESDNRLILAKGTGSCPLNFPQGDFETWER